VLIPEQLLRISVISRCPLARRRQAKAATEARAEKIDE
jgi:hypothetical protein